MNRELDFHDTVMEALPGKAEVAGSMRETLTNLAVDRWRIAVALVLGLLVTAAAWWTAPVTYVSEASLLLRLGRDLGLGLVNAVPGLRRGFMRQAAGLSGEVPKLLTGRAI